LSVIKISEARKRKSQKNNIESEDLKNNTESEDLKKRIEESIVKLKYFAENDPQRFQNFWKDRSFKNFKEIIEPLVEISEWCCTLLDDILKFSENNKDQISDVIGEFKTGISLMKPAVELVLLAEQNLSHTEWQNRFNNEEKEAVQRISNVIAVRIAKFSNTVDTTQNISDISDISMDIEGSKENSLIKDDE